MLIAAAVAAAPTIVGRTPLRNRLLRALVPQALGTMTCEGAQLAWWGGQSLRGLKWVDAAGDPLLVVDEASIETSLVALLADRSTVGLVQVVRPTAYVETRPAGSNWETLLAAQEIEDAPNEAESSPEDRRPPIDGLQIVEGIILGSDQTTRETWRVDHVELTAELQQNNSWLASGSGQASSASHPPGILRFRVEPQSSGGQLELFTEDLPLLPAEAWLARSLPGCRISGTASTDMQIAWSGSANGRPQVQAVGKLGLANVEMTADAFSGDVLRMTAADLSTSLSLAGDRLQVERFAAQGDWFSASAHGVVNLTELARADLSALPTTDAMANVRFDLVQLAGQLPRTLSLREGVRIDAGQIELVAKSLQDQPGRRWTASAAIEDLHGTDGRRTIEWTQGVFATVQLTEASAGPQLDEVQLESPFATAKLTSAAAGVDGQFRFDLEQLSRELTQFVDLSAWRLRGAGSGEFKLRETSDTGVLLTSNADLREIDIRYGDRPVWTDRQLYVDLQAAGQRSDWSLEEVESATLNVRGADDHLRVELLQGVSLRAPDKTYAVHLQGKGPLDSWAGRLRPWVDGVPDEVAGAAAVDARLAVGQGAVQLSDALIDVANLRAQAGNVLVDEPRVRLQGDCRWIAPAGALQSNQLELTTSSVALRSRDLQLQLPERGPAIAHGEVAFRANLERLAALAGMRRAPDAAWPQGEAVGTLSLQSDPTQAVADLQMSGEQVRWVKSDPASRTGVVELWSEPRAEASARLTFQHALDRLTADRLTLRGETVQIVGSIAIDQFRTEQAVRGDVQMTYAAAELAKLLAEYLGPGVRLDGANEARVQFAGRLSRDEATKLISASSEPPHWSRDWQLTTEAGWSEGSLYGLTLGGARLQATLQGGQVVFSGVDVPLGQGRITARPRLKLDPPPALLELPAGPLVSRVAVSPEVTEAALKYAAPILVGATRSQGEFSVELDGGRIPCDDPRLADVGGRLMVHKLQILPGPTTQPLITTVRQLAALSRGQDLLGGAPVRQGSGVTIADQAIDVRIVNGRVYHRQLEFLIDGVPVRSTGSVGFDETIDFVIETEIQEKWVRGSSTLRGLTGQVIQIPVQGTLTRWRVDDRVLGQLLQQGAQQVIGNELNRALDRFLRGK